MLHLVVVAFGILCFRFFTLAARLLQIFLFLLSCTRTPCSYSFAHQASACAPHSQSPFNYIPISIYIQVIFNMYTIRSYVRRVECLCVCVVVYVYLVYHPHILTIYCWSTVHEFPLRPLLKPSSHNFFLHEKILYCQTIIIFFLITDKRKKSFTV